MIGAAGGTRQANVVDGGFRKPARGEQDAWFRAELRRAGARRPASGEECAVQGGAGGHDAPLLQPDVPARPLAGTASVHRVVVAVEALRTGDRARLELGFHDGSALHLDATPAGVALTVAVGPGMARVAAAELPALVAALRQRGITVARAELRVGAQRNPGGARSR